MSEKNLMSHTHEMGTEANILYAQNLSELANFLGISYQTLKKWKDLKSFPPPKKDGRWEIEKIRDWAVEFGFLNAAYSKLNQLLHEELMRSFVLISSATWKRQSAIWKTSIEDTQNMCWETSITQNQTFAKLRELYQRDETLDLGDYLLFEYYFKFEEIRDFIGFLGRLKKCENDNKYTISLISRYLKNNIE